MLSRYKPSLIGVCYTSDDIRTAFYQAWSFRFQSSSRSLALLGSTICFIFPGINSIQEEWYTGSHYDTWFRSWSCGCLVTWFCYQLMTQLIWSSMEWYCIHYDNNEGRILIRVCIKKTPHRTTRECIAVLWYDHISNVMCLVILWTTKSMK